MTTERTSAWPALAGGPQFVAIDSNGNLASKVEDGHSWTYEWNAENELKRVLKEGVELARFTYDPLGRRVEKIAGGVTTSYAYDAEHILKQVAGASSTRYVHGPGTDEPLASENGAGQLTYEHADALGSELKQTDGTGAATLSRSYDAFGQLQAGAATSGYAYTGREWDPETGLYYYRARYYDPKVGRFVSEDSIGLAGGVNVYAYVDNGPSTWIDPFGLAMKPSGPPKGNADAAAVALLKKINPQSIATDYEMCFAVCAKGQSVFTTKPYTNYVDSGTCPKQACPPGSKRVSVCHTHGSTGDPGFSGGDIPDAEVNFVADPQGDITKYDPKKPGNISQQQEYMCRGCAK